MDPSLVPRPPPSFSSLTVGAWESLGKRLMDPYILVSVFFLYVTGSSSFPARNCFQSGRESKYELHLLVSMELFQLVLMYVYRCLT